MAENKKLVTRNKHLRFADKKIINGVPVGSVKRGHEYDIFTLNDIAQDLYGPEYTFILCKKGPDGKPIIQSTDKTVKAKL